MNVFTQRSFHSFRAKILNNILTFFLLAIVILGTSLRYFHLDSMPYGFDEAVNSLHSSGYSKTDLWQQMMDWSGHEVTIDDLRRYQRPTNSDRTSWDAITALGIGEPQNPPLIYLLERVWDSIFSNNDNLVWIKRSLPVTLSILTFPCAYWLCWQLFESVTIASITIALIAVSPLQFVYAREMRMYSLWVVEILLTSAIFLWALRHPIRWRWALYTLISTISLYTFPFSLFVMATHAIYLAIVERLRWSDRLKAFVISTTTSLLLFAPWIWCIVNLDSSDLSDWRKKPPQQSLFVEWIYDLTYSVMAPPEIETLIGNSNIPFQSIFFEVATILTLISSTLVVVYFLRSKKHSATLFLLLFITIPFLCLAVPDLLLGGQRSSIERYLFPTTLGLQIAVAAALGSGINYVIFSPRLGKVHQSIISRFSTSLMIIVMGVGLFSCWQLSDKVAPHQDRTYDYRDISKKIKENPEKPIIFLHHGKNFEGRNLIALGYEFENLPALHVFHAGNIPKSWKCPESGLFLVSIPQADISELEDRCQEPVTHILGESLSLWQVNSRVLK